VDPRDHAAQASAISGLDLAAPHGGLAGLAAALRGRLLVAVPERDEVVDPGPALELARLAGAELVRLDGRCGHAAPTCEAERLAAEVRKFLGSSRP
jgi:homoserine acetyltransferase